MNLGSVKEFLRRYTPNYLLYELKKIISREFVTLLDLGCGNNSVVQYLPDTINKTGVDDFEPSVQESQGKHIHNNYVKADVLLIVDKFKPKSFNVVMAIDLIEHLEKRQALSLIGQMENLATKVVILQTPNGYLAQDGYSGNNLQNHKCGFTPAELRALGYKVLGIGSSRAIRVKKDGSVRKLNFLLATFANLIDPLFRRLPDKSFNIIAYKHI